MCYDDDDYLGGLTDDEFNTAKEIIDIVNNLVESKNKDLVRDNKIKTQNIQDMRKQIRELQQQLKDLPKIKELAHKEAVAGLFNGLRKGQQVWFIHTDYVYTPCSRCEGTGQVTAQLDGEDIKVKCRECDGTKQHSSRKYSPKQSKVRSLSYQVWGSWNDLNESATAYIDHRDMQYQVTNLYTTEEECLVAIKEKEEADANK